MRKEIIIKINNIKTSKYCLIIGGKGIHKARSPKIWNYFFKKSNIDAQMIPLMVDRSEISNLLKFLSKDPKFLGGSVAKPHKEIVFKNVKNLDLAKKIKSVNCIFKINTTLFGDNTDGYGFIKSLRKYKKLKTINNSIVLGYGGVGKSITHYLDSQLNKKSKIYLFRRKLTKTNLSKKTKSRNWGNLSSEIKNVDLVVNCTSLGDINNVNKSPIFFKDSNIFNKKAFFFDAIYNPKVTSFIEYAKYNNFDNLNGLQMNLFQAIRAIYLAMNKKIPQKKIEQILIKRFLN